MQFESQVKKIEGWLSQAISRDRTWAHKTSGKFGV